jgi:hypothetical protein
VTCSTCTYWRKPPPLRPDQRAPKNGQLGLCLLDRRESNPNYRCNRYQLQRSQEAEQARLGLTVAEVIWLREHATDSTAATLIGLYNMVVAAPQDPGARGVFAGARDEWRRRRQQRALESKSSAGNPAGTDESAQNAQHHHPKS